MSDLLTILALYGLLVIVTIVAQVLAALPQVGLVTLARNRDDMPELTGLAGRMVRTVDNSVVAMALFAPAVLILTHQGEVAASALLAAQIFLLARVAYVVIYAAGIPWARTGVWMAGFLATLWLYLLAL
ncbi:MAPEG family protein [Gymnodinialimonas ceratoperidinii]|uniref:MAPEG family protein n=1 Tax=Gymnodinialimonas ceratoperidinii TaxID=2856823 RepID=A0A8F6TXH4_9RHOB|nr:MAPEG family protein [Gymnodinialimonas ceratoperidinii]QXT40475.1 MAPEG family protein [Gymnodinialimonas ceratoperidinii]